MADVDRIDEAALADEWEEQNKTERDNFPEWERAKNKLKVAKATLAAAAAIICESQYMVEGSTQEDRIASLANAADELAAEVASQIERM